MAIQIDLEKAYSSVSPGTSSRIRGWLGPELGKICYELHFFFSNVDPVEW